MDAPTSGSFGAAPPKVIIKNGPCITCKFWHDLDRRCQIGKVPSSKDLTCRYFRG